MIPERKVLFVTLPGLILPSDIINVIFLLFLLLLTVICASRVESWYLLAPLYLIMLASIAFLVWRHRGNPTPCEALLRRWYPLAFVVIIFFSLSRIVHHVLPYDIDSELQAIDYAIFRVHPTVFVAPFVNPYAMDALQLFYASYYFLPVILAVRLYSRRRMDEFEATASAICLAFYLFYIGNILFPSCGPSQTMQSIHTVPLQGKWVGDFIRWLLFALEPYKWDCFPSGHVGVTTVTLVYCYRFERRIFWGMLPVGVGLILSTVLLRYHYVIDVIAGFILAGIVVILSDAIRRAWCHRVLFTPAQSFSQASTQPDKNIS